MKETASFRRQSLRLGARNSGILFPQPILTPLHRHSLLWASISPAEYWVQLHPVGVLFSIKVFDIEENHTDYVPCD